MSENRLPARDLEKSSTDVLLAMPVKNDPIRNAANEGALP